MSDLMTELAAVSPCGGCGGTAVLEADDQHLKLCHCGDGIDHLTIPAIRFAHAAVTAGPWTAQHESCDCGDGYGCSHGSWVYAVHLTDVPSYLPASGVPDDETPERWRTRCEHSELATMPVETAEFMVRSWDYVRVLLARIDELEGGAP